MNAVRVDRFSAFGVNSLGSQGRSIPLSITVARPEGIWTVNAAAARACDLVDVLATGAQETAVVLNVAQSSWHGDDHAPWPLGRIAREQKVDAVVHDIRWAGSSDVRSDDLLILPWRDMPRLLHDWSMYDIDVFDVAGRPSAGEADELALIVNTHDDTRRRCLLPRLPGSRVLFTGHDDCYLHVETTDPALPARLLTRLLALFAGAGLLGDDLEELTVPEPPETIAQELLRRSDHWVGMIAAGRPGRAVTLALTPTDETWRLYDPPPRRTSRDATVHLEAGRWGADFGAAASDTAASDTDDA